MAENKTDKKTDNDVLQPIKNLAACIEAVVFAAGYPVTYQKLSDVTGLSVREVKRMTERLAKEYAKDEHGFMLLCFKDTCQFCTKEQYADYIREALGIRRGGNLSGSSMEVLAVVAYNQPVTRAFIDAVRGVDSNYAVNSLIDKELIAPCGRLEAPGRPILYGTTDKFLRVFGLNSLDELPETETMLPPDKAGEQLSISVEGEEGDEAAADTTEDEAPIAAPTEDEAPTAVAQGEDETTSPAPEETT